MKKIYRNRKLISLILFIMLCSQGSNVLASESDSKGDGLSEETTISSSVEEVFEDNQEDERWIEVELTNVAGDLSGNLQQYIDNYSEDIELQSITKLKLFTQEEYMLSQSDLIFLKNNMQQLKGLDVKNAIFDSQESYESYKDFFQKVEGFEYKFNECSYPLVENEEPQNPETVIEPAEIEAKKKQDDVNRGKGSELNMQNICFVDKGKMINAGVIYTSNDPIVEFRWLQYSVSQGSWTIVSDWQSGNWVTWVPPKKGDYWLCAQGKASDGTEGSIMSAYTYRGFNVKLSEIYVIDQGNRFDMGVVYESNDENIKFRWKIYDLQKQQWAVLQNETSGNWVTWKPKDAGYYWIRSEAVDSLGEEVSYTLQYYFGGLNTELSGIYLIEREKRVDAGAIYASNDAGLKFRWLLYDFSKKSWTQISEWQKGNWISWKPEKSGDYCLYVEARTTKNELCAKSQLYSYKTQITEMKISPDSPGYVGTKIQIAGKYKDFLDEVVTSKYLVYNGKTWSELKQTGNEVFWNAQELGMYWFCYQIYGKDNNLIDEVTKAFSIEQPYVNLGGISIRKDGDLRYTLGVNSDTNDKQIQYRWMYYDLALNKWAVICDWNIDTSVKWNAPREGGYWLHVEAKLHNNTVKSQTLAYNVEIEPIDKKMMRLNANMYSSSTEYCILVNRSTHKVGVFQGWQGNWNCIQYWECSDGAPSTPTVEGVFRVGSRGFYFDSGSARCFWYTQFHGNYLFHSVLYNKYNGTLMDGRLGLPLSHGCVRMQIQNAKWIYDTIPSGTTVVVYH